MRLCDVRKFARRNQQTDRHTHNKTTVRFMGLSMVFIVVIVADEERIIIFFAKLNAKQFSDLNCVVCVRKGDRPLAIFNGSSNTADFNCIGLLFCECVCVVHVRVSTS